MFKKKNLIKTLSVCLFTFLYVT
ncbi:MAG: SVM family protein [Nonlabens sp.]